MHEKQTVRTWMYWEQGFENAPRLVKLCKDSWAAVSDDLVALDKSSLGVYLPESETAPLFQEHVLVQARSDLIRLKLLLKYGGIWADATLLCTRDYHEWLNAEMSPFPVLYPHTDRLISSWMLYSNPDSPILNLLHDELWRIIVLNKFRCWRDNDGLVVKTMRRLTKSVLKRIRIATGREYWKLASVLSTPAMIRLLRGYPYQLIHFTYARILLELGVPPNEEPFYIPAVDCHRLQYYLRGTTAYSAGEILALLERAPVHKLARDLSVPDELLGALKTLREKSHSGVSSQRAMRQLGE